VTGGTFARHHGGKGGNQAVAAARLGATTAFVGAVGGDSFGIEARTALAVEGIDLRGLVILDREATGVALILVDVAGENSIAVAGGANGRLTPQLVADSLRLLEPRAGDIVLVGHEIPTDATRAAVHLARDAAASTILNPAPAGGLDIEALALADILTPNRGELAVLIGDDGSAVGPAAAALLRASQTAAILVSLGPDGALLVDAHGAATFRVPSVRAVDTVGAGDALNGALAAGLASGLDLPEAARRAVVTATLATTRAGAREGMPSLAELQAADGG
jgi:ribokinase